MPTSSWTSLTAILCATAIAATAARAQTPVTSIPRILADLALISETQAVLRCVTRSPGFRAVPTTSATIAGARDYINLTGSVTTEPYLQVAISGMDVFQNPGVKYTYSASVVWYGARTSTPAGIKVSRVGSYSVTVVLEQKTKQLALNPFSALTVYQSALGTPLFDPGCAFSDALGAYGFAALDCDRNWVGFGATQNKLTVPGVPDVTFNETASAYRQGVLTPNGDGFDTLQFARNDDFNYRLCAALSGTWNKSN